MTYLVTLFNLFAHKCEDAEQLHQCLDKHLGHGDCRRDLGIDIEVIEKMFDRHEQINESIVTGTNDLGHLTHTDVRRIRVKSLS